jgi:hypothetical protein
MKMHAVEEIAESFIRESGVNPDQEAVSHAFRQAADKIRCKFELVALMECGEPRTTETWLQRVGLKLRFESHDLRHPLHDFVWTVGRLMCNAAEEWKPKHNKKFTEEQWANLPKGEFTARGMKALADALKANTPNPAPFFTARTYTAMWVCEALARDWDRVKLVQPTGTPTGFAMRRMRACNC